MNAKHTPGPWSFLPNGEIQAESPASPLPYTIALAFGDSVVGRGRSEANARLIAAAPELLEALQNLENDDGAIPDHAWALVQAAIAKATGEQ